jgi:hypothetical protein
VQAAALFTPSEYNQTPEKFEVKRGWGGAEINGPVPKYRVNPLNQIAYDKTSDKRQRTADSR